MNYIIRKNGIEVNRIVADEEFCQQYYSGDGYSYEAEPDDPPPAPDQPTVEQVREEKLKEAGDACTAAIYAGVDVEGSHYSLTEHDQMEIMAQYATIKEGAAAVPYHADGELCRMYTAEEFTALAQAATSHIFAHRTYCNHLNAWIRRADLEELAGIVYGAELPEDLEQRMLEILAAAEAEKTLTAEGGADDAV